MKKLTGLTLRLEVKIKYELNGASARYLEELLRDNVGAMAGDGLMTGVSDAEVIGWYSQVVRVEEVFGDPDEE